MSTFKNPPTNPFPPNSNRLTPLKDHLYHTILHLPWRKNLHQISLINLSSTELSTRSFPKRLRKVSKWASWRKRNSKTSTSTKRKLFNWNMRKEYSNMKSTPSHWKRRTLRLRSKQKRIRSNLWTKSILNLKKPSSQWSSNFSNPRPVTRSSNENSSLRHPVQK